MASPPLFAILLLAALSPAQRTWIVNKAGGAGVDFTDIPPAIAAAAPGDTVRVTGGSGYMPIVLTKALVVEAPLGSTCGTFPSNVPSIDIRGIQPGSTARVSGFSPFIGTGMQVTQCGGTVVLQRLSGFQLTVNNATAVLGVDSTFAGRSEPPYRVHPAVNVSLGQVILQRCSLNGLPGNLGGSFIAASDGGSALAGSAATLVCVGSTIAGGAGANGDFGSNQPCGTNGGSGVDAVSGTFCVVLGNTTLRGGAAGANLVTTCAATVPGAAASGNVSVSSDVSLSGSLVNGARRIRSLAWITSPGTATLGSPVTIQLTGAPSTLLGLHVDNAFGVVAIPGFDTPYLGTLNAIHVANFTLGATRTLSLTFTVPTDPYLAGRMAYFLALAVEPGTNALSFTNLGDLLLR